MKLSDRDAEEAESRAMDERLVLYNAKAKIAGICLFLWFAGGACIWMAVSADTTEYGLLIFGLVCIVVPLLRAIPKLYDSTPRLIVDAKGIDIRSSNFGLILWEDIEKVWIKRRRFYEGLCIQLKDPQKYMSSPERIFRKPDQWIGWGSLNVNTMGLNGSVYDV